MNYFLILQNLVLYRAHNYTDLQLYKSYRIYEILQQSALTNNRRSSQLNANHKTTLEAYETTSVNTLTRS